MTGHPPVHNPMRSTLGLLSSGPRPALHGKVARPLQHLNLQRGTDPCMHRGVTSHLILLAASLGTIARKRATTPKKPR